MRAHHLLVLGLVAIAPTTARSEEDGARVPFRGDGEPYRPSRSERDWIRLASPTPTRFGTEYIVVGRDAGLFRSLRIDAVSGTVVVRRVSVLTHDGRWRTFQVRRTLDRRHPSFYVAIGAATPIALIAVTTDRKVAGSYTIHGSSGQVGPALVTMR